MAHARVGDENLLNTCQLCAVLTLPEADRRVKCEGSMPACLQCLRTSNICQGYGNRLSWPEEKDRKQGAIFCKSSRRTWPVGRLRLVNVSTWDVEIHRCLSHCASSRILGGHQSSFSLPTIPAQIPSRQLNTAAEHDLFQYCVIIALLLFEIVLVAALTVVLVVDHVVVQVLATIPRTTVTLRTVIARLALSSNTQSSQAVMQSLFALSSLHRHGIQLQSTKFKALALRALRASSSNGIGRHEVAQHIASLMLLCSFEVSLHEGYKLGLRLLIRFIHPK